MFYGKVNRSDLMKHGEISIATSSRAFNQYREKFPENIQFDVGRRCYIRTITFQPKFYHDAFSALRLFAWGKEETQIETETYGVQSSARIIENISVETLSHITRAIVAELPLMVEYNSSRGKKTRIFSPHTVFFSLEAWHVRGWDSEANNGLGGGRSFRISRFVSATHDGCAHYILPEQDLEWQTPIILSVAPHSQHENGKNLIWELEMDGKPMRNIPTNAALAGYVLNDLRVDCSVNGILPPNIFSLQLMNRHEVEGIESIQTLGPGFTME
jgi:hypothetical protein